VYDLRSQIAFAIITSTIILASVVATIPTVYAATYNFELTATGQARDRYGNPHNVDLSLIGTGDGSLTWLVSLHVASGTVTIEGLGTYNIVGGWGTLIQRYHYIYLYIRITPLSGGPITGWYMRRTTGGITYDNIIPLTLSSRYIILPIYPRTVLYKLMLTGQIQLF